MRHLALLIALPLLAACAAEGPLAARLGQAPPAAAVREAVLAELTRYYADFSARDWPAFADHFWPGATLTTLWQPPDEETPRVVASTVAEFVAQAPGGPGSKPIFEERLDWADVRATGNLAQVWAHYTVRFGAPGDVAEWHGVDALTLMHHEGRWKIVGLAFTNTD